MAGRVVDVSWTCPPVGAEEGARDEGDGLRGKVSGKGKVSFATHTREGGGATVGQKGRAALGTPRPDRQAAGLAFRVQVPVQVGERALAGEGWP